VRAGAPEHHFGNQQHHHAANKYPLHAAFNFGVISVTSNIAARDMAEMCKLAAEGHFQEARLINQRLMPLHNKLFVEPNPIPVKWACKALGLVATDTLRLPMTPITDHGREVVAEALKHAGLL
jgi:4-hydroxy-tetrahydrodipicolinate synthase